MCAEVMRAMDIKVSWLIHLSNDTENSGMVTPGLEAWVVVFVFEEEPRGHVLDIKDHTASLDMLCNSKRGTSNVVQDKDKPFASLSGLKGSVFLSQCVLWS